MIPTGDALIEVCVSAVFDRRSTVSVKTMSGGPVDWRRHATLRRHEHDSFIPLVSPPPVFAGSSELLELLSRTPGFLWVQIECQGAGARGTLYLT